MLIYVEGLIMKDNNSLTINDESFRKSVLKTIKDNHKRISSTPTPAELIKEYNGQSYVEDKYIRARLNEEFPVWSWEIDKSEFLGAEWVVVTGTLSIYDEGVSRKYSAVAASRIHYKRGSVHTPENIINISHNVQAANTNAFKRAVNRLCNISDDVYNKSIDSFFLDEKAKKEIMVRLDGLEEQYVNDRLQQIKSGEINFDNFNAVIKRLDKEREYNGLEPVN